MRELSLFTGAGGGLTGSALSGWNPIGYVEIDEYCQKVIRQRIEDGCIPKAPIFTDIRSFTREGYARRYRGMVDIVTAGFPCQPFSLSGKRKGGNDERNMWPATVNVLRQVRPRYVLLENVASLLTHEYGRRIFGSLAKLGLDARWGVLGGQTTGNISNGSRIWILAFKADCTMLESLDVPFSIQSGTKKSFRRQHTRAVSAMLQPDDYARIKRNPNDVARGMERLKAIGNGQMGPVATRAWRLLSQ